MNRTRTGRKKSALGSPALPRSAFDDACRFLGRRRLTESEIRARLAPRYPEPQIEETVGKLKEYRFLEDEALIADHCRDRLNLTPRSRELLAAELERRGIDAELFQRIFQREFPSYDELTVAGQALTLQFRSSALTRLLKTPAQARREKVLRFLRSRGFSYEVMLEAWEGFRMVHGKNLEEKAVELEE